MSGAVWSSDGTDDDRVSVHDRGFLLGDGVFDTLVAFNRTPFMGERHLRRLVEQAAVIGVTVDEHKIRQGWTSVLTQTGDDAAIIRTTVTRGRTERGLWPLAAGEPTIVAVAAGWSNQLLGRPVRLFTSTIRRNEHSPASKLKALGYLDQILAAREAQASGADDALLLNTAGSVACTTIANIFVIEDDRLITPPIKDGVMPGVMRSLVLEHAQAVGLTATEATLTLEELRCAEVAFTTNSVRFLQPVLTLDGHSLGEPPDSRLSMLCAGVADRVRAECCYRLEAP